MQSRPVMRAATFGRFIAKKWRGLTALAILAPAIAGCRREPAAAARQDRAQVTEAVAPQYPASAFPSPNRPVASIVSPKWDDEGARDRVREADTVMALLGITSGMGVADIGAGSGYYTVRLSPRVGPAGRVYAEDIMPEYLRALANRVAAANLSNVQTVLGAADHPRLPPASIDRALFVHMYHEIQQPYALMYNLYPSLRSGAVVGVVDVDRPTRSHGTPPAQLRCEMSATGFRQIAFHALRVGYLAVFTPLTRNAPDDVRTALARPGFKPDQCQ